MLFLLLFIQISLIIYISRNVELDSAFLYKILKCAKRGANGGKVAKLEAKYIPIGTKLEEPTVDNSGKSLKEIEAAATQEKRQRANKNEKKKTKLSGTLQPIGAKQPLAEPKVDVLSIPDVAEIKPLAPINDQPIEPLVSSEPEEELLDDLFDENFLAEIESLEQNVEAGIKSGEIKLIITNADQNLNNITDIFDQAIAPIQSSVNYQVRDEKKVSYDKELPQINTKLDKLEQTIDHDTYHSELRINEFEDSKLRENRYRKRRLEGLDEVGVRADVDHNTSEQNPDIGLKKNTDFAGETQKGRLAEDVVRREFVQDYEGSDLEGIDKERDKLEQEILKNKLAKEKAEGKSKKKKTEEEKIAEAKERLRRKHEKRKAKQQKKLAASDVAEIDLVGNQFDVDEMREEKMDRLLEIKQLSAEKKELQKLKEKQRTKATKEFYKYKKVNKKSHIVGFKQ